MAKSTLFISLQFHYFGILGLILTFLVIMAILFTCIGIFVIYYKRAEFHKKNWKLSVSGIISECVFEEWNASSLSGFPAHLRSLFNKKHFRDFLINELVHTKKSLAGSSTDNLKNLYCGLQLQKDSYNKLQSKKWHIKAKGVEELGMMEQKQYCNEIIALANDENELVRNEAQCAVVSLYGFEGLSFFLKDITYPISCLQQIQLLYKLGGLQPSDWHPLQGWLQSANDSVVEFAVKLAALYNNYEVYDEVVTCLKNSSLQVKLTIIEYLKKAPREDAAEEIKQYYHYESKTFRISAIRALQYIGDEKHIPFIQYQLHDVDNDIRLQAAKSLLYLRPAVNSAAGYVQSDDAPQLEEMFPGITKEYAA
ncbi:MAG: HEAT repeat domain-containing protein [Ginsengibacter sp.]